MNYILLLLPIGRHSHRNSTGLLTLIPSSASRQQRQQQQLYLCEDEFEPKYLWLANYEPDMAPKGTKNVCFCRYHSPIRQQIRSFRVNDVISQDIRTVDTASERLIVNLGMVANGVL